MSYIGLTLETERLLLRVPDISEASGILEYHRRNRAFLQRWEPARADEFFTPEYHRDLLQYETNKTLQGEMVRFWIYKKTEPERPIGTFCFSNIVRGGFQSCFLGYKLDEAEVGKGYMTEALQRGIRFAFDELKLHRIEANIMPRNAASISVVTKLGFEQEGLSRKYLKINGVWEDHYHYVLLNAAVE